MRGRACSEKLFSLLIFERSDAMLKIRRNQELTMRISSIMFIRINVGFHHEILKDHGVFPRALSDELLFELRVAPASNVVIVPDKTQLAYELTNIHFEYESFAVKNPLMRPCLTTKIGNRFICELVTEDSLCR